MVHIGAEANRCLEIALERGRRIEVFIAEETNRKAVTERRDRAFLAAYKEGRYKVVELTGMILTIYVDHSCPNLVLGTAKASVIRLIIAA